MKIIYIGILFVIVLMKEATGGGNSVPEDYTISFVTEKVTEPTESSTTSTEKTSTSTTTKEVDLTTMSTPSTTLAPKTTTAKSFTTSKFGGGVGRPTPTSTATIAVGSTTTEIVSSMLPEITTTSEKPITTRVQSVTTSITFSESISTTAQLSIPVTVSNLAPEDQPLEDCIILPSGEVLNKGGDCFSSCDSKKNLSLYHIDDSKVLCCCKVESS